jgi:hypothetical protein
MPTRAEILHLISERLGEHPKAASREQLKPGQ